MVFCCYILLLCNLERTSPAKGPAQVRVIALLAFASGAQVEIARSLRITNIITAMATAAFFDLFIDFGLLARESAGNQEHAEASDNVWRGEDVSPATPAAPIASTTESSVWLEAKHLQSGKFVASCTFGDECKKQQLDLHRVVHKLLLKLLTSRTLIRYTDDDVHISTRQQKSAGTLFCYSLDRHILDLCGVPKA
jgi:Protein of unknown function (DUF1275)